MDWIFLTKSYNINVMKSLRELLIEGNGPSSSHTIGPYRAAKAFLSLLGDKPCDEIDVTLYRYLIH